MVGLETNVNNLLLSSGVSKTVSSVAQNQTILCSYTDNTDGNMLYVNNSATVVQTPTSKTNYVEWGTFAISGTKVNGPAGCWTYTVGAYARLNVAYTTAFVCSLIEFQVSYGTSANGSIASFSVYGSNNTGYYNDTSSSTTGLSLLFTQKMLLNHQHYIYHRQLQHQSHINIIMYLLFKNQSVDHHVRL